MSIKVGALFAGYGGIELALAQVAAEYGAEVELVWYCEVDPAASKVLAHHFPGVPNLGDVTKVDWSTVREVDVICGGSPCQDLSHAGKRAGMKAGTRSGLWASMCDAIDTIRPSLVIWENVRGALSAEADSEMEQCPRCVGDPRDRGPVLRALGRVVGDLADMRYVGRVYGLRAADVGGAHGRFRVFLFATPADAGGLGWGEGASDWAGPGAAPREGKAGRTGGHPLLGTDAAPDLTLLPTPAVNDMGAGKTPDAWDAWTERMRSEHGNGNGHGKSLEIEALRLLPTPTVDDAGNIRRDSGAFQSLTRSVGALLPTPTVGDSKSARNSTATRHVLPPTGIHAGDTLTDALVPKMLPTPSVADVMGGRKARSVDRSNELLLNGIAAAQDWREYEAAIRRCEHAWGRPAPLPTEAGKNDKPRLSPRFVEWLMGLPEGHVTDPAIGISRNDQLKALGNGVVPQQCAAALRAFLNDTRSAA